MSKFKFTLTCLALVVVGCFSVACNEPHVHTYSEELAFDETYHWYASTCEHTEEVKDKKAHDFGDGIEQDNGDLLFTCNDCSYQMTIPHTHTYAEELTNDKTHHWYASTCGHNDEVKDKAEHNFGEGVEQPNGDLIYTCADCLYQKTDVHTHTFDTEYSKDDNYHWYKATCKHENEIKDKGVHDFDDGVEQVNGDVIYTCEECSYQKTVVHTHLFDTVYSKDDNYHWYKAICKHDSEIKGKEEHDFDEGAEQVNGDVIYTCKDCSYQKTDVHTHTFDTEYSKDETYHWYKATCKHSLETKDKAEHSYDEGVKQSNGDILFTCDDCGYQTTAIHTHTYDTEYSKNDTHHWFGSTCGHTEAIDGYEEHDFDDGEKQSNGDVIYTCNDCSYQKTEVHTHTYDTEYSKNETHHWFDSICGHTEAIDGYGEHEFDEGVEQANGDVIYTCGDCLYQKTDVHIHTFENEYSKDDNYHWYKATCKHTSEVKDKEVHDFDDGVEQPNGDVIYTCNDCGYSKNDAHVHTHESKYSKNDTHHWYEPTCEHTEAIKGYEEHDFDDGVVLSNLSRRYTCVDCGYSYTLLSIVARLKDQNATWARTEDLASLIEVLIVNKENQTDGEWLNIYDYNVKEYTINQDNVEVIVSVTIANVEFTDTVVIPLRKEVVGVGELLTSEIDGKYILKGIVAGFAPGENQTEVIVIDKTSGQIINVVNLGYGEIIWGGYNSKGIEIGDEIEIPVMLRKATTDSTSANSDKLYAEFVGGNDYSSAILSSGNAISIADGQTIINSQADLNEFLSEQNRVSNQYKYVTLRGEMKFVIDTEKEFFRFWFYDQEVSDLADTQISGIAPVFSNNATKHNVGKNFGELMFANKFTSNTDVLKPIVKIVEIKALYVGGDSEFSQFVILDKDTGKEITPVVESIEFTPPTQQLYPIGRQLDLTGGSITVKYEERSSIVIELTEEMLFPSTIPDFTTAGEYTIEGSYEGKDFSFVITVVDLEVKSIAIETMPTKTTYSHRDVFGDIDLTGGELLVTYEDDSSEVIPMNKEMISLEESDELKMGEVNYILTYLSAKTSLTVTYEYQGKTVSEFVSGTVGEKYELTGIVVGAVTSHASAELLIKDKSSMNFISVTSTGVVGTYSAPKLDTTVLNAGDEIIFTATLAQTASDASATGNRKRISASVDGLEFTNNLIKISTGNALNYDLTGDNVTEITTQSELSTFLKSDTRFFKVVKFVGLKAINYSSKGYRIFFGDEVTSNKTQFVNGVSPYLFYANSNNYLTNNLQTYFTNSTATAYTDPAVANCDIYAIFVGGNSYYHNFVVLSDSWLISK